jgi:hypothetical protein
VKTAGQVLQFALLHYVVFLLLAGMIFLVIHVPPKAVNLDGLILALVQCETVLMAPRKFLLWLWPGETTPSLLGVSTTVLNSLIWGLALAAGRVLWKKVR